MRAPAISSADAGARATMTAMTPATSPHPPGPAPFSGPERVGLFLSVSLFTGAPLRAAIEEGRADFMPIFLSDIPNLFATRRVPLDAALLQLSPPDRHGHCTLGTSVDAAKGAADPARVLLAEINERMPPTP